MDLGSTFIREFCREDGTSLKIAQLEIGDVGCVVWDAAIVLSYFIDTTYFTNESGGNILEGKYVLELGAGTGLVGIQAAVKGANCVLTDLEEFIPLLIHNIELNRNVVKGRIQAKSLKWGENVDEFLYPDFILLADCIYYDEGAESLFSSLCQLSDDHTVIYFCYEIRETSHKRELEAKFFKLIESRFVIANIPVSCQHPEYHSEDIAIYRFSKKCNTI